MTIMGYMGRTSRSYALFRDKKLEGLGLSGYKGTYLSVISRNPGITQEEIARDLVFNKSSVARQIAELEKKGFVRRKRSTNDKRQIRVYATQKGKDALNEVFAASREFLSCIKSELSEEETDIMLRLCARLCDRAKEMIDSL